MTPRHRLLLLWVFAVLSLAALGGCGDDDDDGGGGGGDSEQSSREAYRQAGCTIAAKTVEGLASLLRQGHSVREAIDEYSAGLDKGCEFVVEAWFNRPKTQLDITVTGLSGSTLDGQVSGGSLRDLAPADETGQRSCENWDDELLESLCARGP